MLNQNTKDCIEIIYAHNEQQITKLFLSMFENQINDGTIRIHTAQSKYEIIEQVSTNKINVLIIDEGLTHPDAPKTFNKLRAVNPDLKILVLLSKIRNNPAKVNPLSQIQYCKKPYKFQDLYWQIQEIYNNKSLAVKNLQPADLVYLLSVLEEMSNVCLQNEDNHSSGEIFIVDGKVISASVDGCETILSDEQAIEEILKWSRFESNYGDAFFPEEPSVLIDPYVFLKDGFKAPESHITENIMVPTIKVTPEMKKKLREYLSMASYALPDDFVMNAFCNHKCEMFVSIKHPDLQEQVHKLGDIIINTFLKNSTRMKRSFLSQDIIRLDLQYYMAVYRLDNNFWYFTILKSDAKINTLNEVVNEFSYHAIRVLYDNKAGFRQILEEVA